MVTVEDSPQLHAIMSGDDAYELMEHLNRGDTYTLVLTDGAQVCIQPWFDGD
jgi:hypothetical protein